MNHLTTIAALPGSGAGCKCALKVEAAPEIKRPTMYERAPALLEGMKEGFYSIEEGGLVRIGSASAAPTVNVLCSFTVGDEAALGQVKQAVLASQRRAHTYADRFNVDERN